MTAGDDDALRVYSTQSGVELNQIWSKRHGICHITYTHDPQGVVYASNKVPQDGIACLGTWTLSSICPMHSLTLCVSCHGVLGTAQSLSASRRARSCRLRFQTSTLTPAPLTLVASHAGFSGGAHHPIPIHVGQQVPALLQGPRPGGHHPGHEPKERYATLWGTGKSIAQLCSLAASLVLRGPEQCLPASGGAVGCFSAVLPTGANSALCGNLTLPMPSSAHPSVELASADHSGGRKTAACRTTRCAFGICARLRARASSILRAQPAPASISR